MRKYQLIMKPNATATGEPGRWSFVAHGAAYTKEEADARLCGAAATYRVAGYLFPQEI